MRLKTLLLVTALMSGAAYAGSDKLIMAPAPAWVKPVVLPTKLAKADEAPLRVVLADQQTKLELGRVSNYLDVALQLQTPQGLAAGNLSFPWNPETDELTVHKLIVHREGKIIDVLAAGQTFSVVRREPNLESAMLDGVLTANIQPEGLQVGDILEYAITITSSDPVLKGHVEQTAATWNGFPFARAHFRVEWPNALPVVMRQEGALPPLKPVKSGVVTSVELSLEDVQPIVPPRLAPQRYAIARIAEFSNFKSWAEAGALLAPLYDVAARVPAEGPLRAELEKIKAASSDPVKRAEAALALVQDRVRYVALLMGAGGLTPANAAETWGRRYGDCKAKTALLLALLQELGIEAEPVAVNAISGDGLDKRLPMLGLFNHVLVRAHIGGRAYWLDGTRSGDASLARLRTPDFGWGLPLLAKDAALVRMQPGPLDQPDYDLLIEIDARAGLSLPAIVMGQVTLSGDDAIGTRLSLANMDAAARDNALRDYWKERIDDIEISKVGASFDPATGRELLTMEGKADMDWKDEQYWTDGTWVGYEADFSRTSGSNPDAPFAVEYPMHSRTVETIQLPPGFTEQNIFRREPISETVAGISYSRTSSLKDNVFRIERTMRATVPEFAAQDAPAAQKRLRELADLQVSLRKPRNYKITAAERDVQLQADPKTVDDFLRRASLLVESKRYEEARTAVAGALKLDPDSDRARLGMLATFGEGNTLEAAAKYAGGIDLKQVDVAELAMNIGGIAMMNGDMTRAIAGYDRSLVLQPNQPLVLSARAWAHLESNRDAAFADAMAAAKLKPQQAEVNMSIATVLENLGRREEALDHAETILKAHPDNIYIRNAAARIFGRFGQRDRALAEFDKAIAIKPDLATYVNRAAMRPQDDLAGRQADLEAALKLSPDQPYVRGELAQLQLKKGDFAGAISIYSDLLKKTPADANLLSWRGIAYAKAGEKQLSQHDFAAARAKVDHPGVLNNLCWNKAIEGVALETALAECDASLAKEAGRAATLDSRALVLLRLGRIDDAIASYDKALAKTPEAAGSLYGRAVAWSRKGDKTRAATDRDKALKADPEIEQRFAGYGVTIAP